MRVWIDTPLMRENGTPHRLFLEPESERDERVLERLLERYRLANFGRHPETGKLLHVAVEIIEQINVDFEPRLA